MISKEKIIVEAAKLDISLAESDIEVGIGEFEGGWMIDGMIWHEWLDAMADDDE